MSTNQFDQTLQSTGIRGPIELKFGGHIHDLMIFNLNDGDRFWTAGWTEKSISSPLNFGSLLEPTCVFQIGVSGIRSALDPTLRCAPANPCAAIFSKIYIFKRFPWFNPLFRVSLLSLHDALPISMDACWSECLIKFGCGQKFCSLSFLCSFVSQLNLDFLN